MHTTRLLFEAGYTIIDGSCWSVPRVVEQAEML